MSENNEQIVHRSDRMILVADTSKSQVGRIPKSVCDIPSLF